MPLSAFLPRSLPAVGLGAVLVAAGCSPGGDDPSEPDGETRTVEAANGSVEVPAEPQSVAVLWRPTLGAATQLGHDVVATMGTPGQSGQGLEPFLPEGADADALTVVTNSPSEEDVNIEELANTAPDLIIGVDTQMGAQAEMLDDLEQIAPTVLLEWDGTGAWRGHLEEVAEVLDEPDRAEEAVAEYDEAVEEAREELSDAGTDPAETELSLVRLQDESEVRLETSASFPGQVVDDLGFARPDDQIDPDGETDFVPRSYENLDSADGDAVFVLTGSGYPEAPDTFSDGVWANLSAVQDEQVFHGDHDVWGAASYYAAHRIVEEVTAALTGEAEPAV
ncbi:ABC transporter substrate-binding protein [Nocardiopsis sp. HNM0947]|uniref:ABC transporter substrate-binding protein n=1 Tax=Nocardiopsis coralli TaxID=2772213 RepID=A0ABR9P9S0_9ACTN|nr:ABC transporter substrate-binding protein [Nocardiopsis coralli]MBE3000574.1 ABC transporter substrate-binding protein [Nocardiopsis coralli]